MMNWSPYLASDHSTGGPCSTPNPARTSNFDFFNLFVMQSIKQIETSNLMYHFLNTVLFLL